MSETKLDNLRDREWTLDGLVEQAKLLLKSAPNGPEDDRIRAFPDARTIRYYQSMGVVSRPVRYDGRRAIYGYNHLLQAVTVKTLQAEGYSLAQIQSRLPALSTRDLEAALVEVLGAAPAKTDSAVPVVPTPAAVASATWSTVEIAPGVLVSIDARQADPETVLPALIRAISPTGGAQ